MTTNTSQQGLSIEDFWAMFQETERQIKESHRETERQMKESQKETERQMRETERQMKESQRETERQMKESQRETERQMKESQKETDKQIQALGEKIAQVSSNVGGLNNDLGDFAEGLLTTDVLKKFEAYNLGFDDALYNIEIRERGARPRRVLAEIDCLLLNTTAALVCEVKMNLTKGDIEKHINRIKLLSSKPNGLLGGKKLYGAVAGVKMRDQTKEFARQKGLFVLEPSGGSVHIEPPIGAPAVW
jgi:hypothetical protein